MPGSARGHYRPPARSWLTPNRRGLPETRMPRQPARGRDPWTEANRSGETQSADPASQGRTPQMERREAPALSKRQRGLRKTGAPRGAPFPSDCRGGETCPRQSGGWKAASPGPRIIRAAERWLTLFCRPRESGDPVLRSKSADYWMPACAGMTPRRGTLRLASPFLMHPRHHERTIHGHYHRPFAARGRTHRRRSHPAHAAAAQLHRRHLSDRDRSAWPEYYPLAARTGLRPADERGLEGAPIHIQRISESWRNANPPAPSS